MVVDDRQMVDRVVRSVPTKQEGYNKENIFPFKKKGSVTFVNTSIVFKDNLYHLTNPTHVFELTTSGNLL